MQVRLFAEIIHPCCNERALAVGRKALLHHACIPALVPAPAHFVDCALNVTTVPQARVLSSPGATVEALLQVRTRYARGFVCNLIFLPRR
jgi:hypothetical protein